ncbi:MAG: heavy metal translocating P-type ATPase, partial [Maribacter sp.]|nr:heavy metal translocating P-type ATPase [Maribacter sp.]
MKKKKIDLQSLTPTQSTCAHCSDDEHTHEAAPHSSNFKLYLPAIISFTMLVIGIALDYFNIFTFFQGYIRLAWYIAAYIPVGLPVLKEGWESIKKGNF